MLVFSRKNGEAILLSNGVKTIRIVVRCDDHILRLYRSKTKLAHLESVQDQTCLHVLGYPVTICLVRFRGYNDITIGLEADRGLTIIREEFVG